MVRFGSWCYSGRVQLTASLSLSDLPHVIPALRMQQSRLEFLCDVASMPARSPFVKPMEFASKVAPVMESEVMNSESVLMNLVERLGNMGLGDSISQWLEGDPQTEDVREGKGGEDVEVTDRLQSVNLSEPVAESKSDAPTITKPDTPSSPVPAAKGVEEEPRSLASPTADPGTPVSEAKKTSPSSASGDNRKQSLGAFHHLAHMRKPSGLEGKLGDIRKSMGPGPLGGPGGGGAAPWDPFGKPVLGGGKKLGAEAKP